MPQSQIIRRIGTPKAPTTPILYYAKWLSVAAALIYKKFK